MREGTGLNTYIHNGNRGPTSDHKLMGVSAYIGAPDANYASAAPKGCSLSRSTLAIRKILDTLCIKMYTNVHIVGGVT